MSAAGQEDEVAARLRNEALEALDRLLGQTPPATVDDAIQAMRRIVALRDHLIARRREQGGSPALDARLACVNATLSLTWSGAVPIFGFRHERLEKAREALATD